MTSNARGTARNAVRNAVTNGTPSYPTRPTRPVPAYKGSKSPIHDRNWRRPLAVMDGRCAAMIGGGA